MGVPCGEPTPVQGCAANGLVLEQVEILENDGGETTESGDGDVFLLCQLHRIEHLATRRLETAEHLGHEAGVDVGPLDGGADRTRDLNMLHQLGWGTAPHVEIPLRDVIEAEFHRLATRGFKTR